MKRYYSFKKFSEELKNEYKLPFPDSGSIVEFKDYSGRTWKLGIARWRFFEDDEYHYFYVFVNAENPDEFVYSVYSGGETGGGIHDWEIKRFSREDHIDFVKFYDE